MTGQAAFTYDRGTIRLHWLTAALVPLMWAIGLGADFLPRGSPRTAALSVHVLLGFTLASVVVLRLARRAGRAVRPLHDSLIARVSAASHLVIYLMLVVVLALGLWNAFLRGENLFDLVRLPQIPSERPFRRMVSGWHHWCAHTLMVLAVLHASMALVHHYVWRDDILRRMWPGLAARPR